ncbi:MAG: DUF4340 domain-containing protein [Vicinamibacterales bacterium]
MRGGWSTLALVVAAVGLGAYIYFVDSERPETEAKAKVFAVEADAIEEIRVAAKGETSLLRKTNGTWAMVEPIATDVDQNEVSALVSGLANLEENREVEPNAANLAEFGLAEPKADITFKAAGGATGRVRLGDQTPTAGDMYAVKDDGARVFLVATFTENTLARSSFDLRDKRVLRFERDKADGLEIRNAKGTAVMTRADSVWRITSPSNARGDYGVIEGLLTKLSTTMMAAIVAPEVKDPVAFGLDKPVATVVVKTGSSAATLVLGTTVAGRTFARDLSRAMVFTVDESMATDMIRGAEEYRRKEIFDARGFSAREVVLTRGAQTVTLAKVKGEGENAAEKWTVAVTGDGAFAARDADATTADDLLTKLTGLRAATFTATAPAGTTAALKAAIRFDESSREEVSVARQGTTVVATRADEAGAATLEASPFDEVIKAIDAVIAPPAPPAAATTPAAAAPPEKKQ